MLTQLGYGLGLFLLVPLGDMIERRKLITVMLVLAGCALSVMAISPNTAVLYVISLAVGLASVVPQMIVPFAADLAQTKERGRVIGKVMSGLLIGILLARTFSGFVGAGLGWRTVYWIAAGLMLLLAVLVARLFPQSVPAESGLSYRQVLASLGTLIKEQPVLREAAMNGALIFACFSVFWSTLVFFLNGHYAAGSETAGLFGLVGVVGAMAAPIVGRIADHRSPRLTVGLAVVIILLSFLCFWMYGFHWWGLIVGVILLDLGTQSGQISNQTRVYSLIPGARNRLNTVYMVSYFAGGALGSYFGALCWSLWGWRGVCFLGIGLMLTASIIHGAGSRRTAGQGNGGSEQ